MYLHWSVYCYVLTLVCVLTLLGIYTGISIIYLHRYVYCEKCFDEIHSDIVDLSDEITGNPVQLPKSSFIKTKVSLVYFFCPFTAFSYQFLYHDFFRVDLLTESLCPSQLLPVCIHMVL